MATMRGTRVPVGSAAWITDERSSARQMTQSEVEEFSFSARNEIEWLNEHMAEIFSENQINVAEIFKTPGKLRGRTPRTARKANAGEARVPLSDIFSATPRGAPNPFTIPNLNQSHTPKIKVAEDKPVQQTARRPSPARGQPNSSRQAAPQPSVSATDSGYHGSQSGDIDMDELARDRQDIRPGCKPLGVQVTDFAALHAAQEFPDQASPTRGSIEETFESAKEEQTRHVADETTAMVTAPCPPPKVQLQQQPVDPVPSQPPSQSSKPASPTKSSPAKSSPTKSSPTKSSPAKSSPRKSPPRKHAAVANLNKPLPEPANDADGTFDMHVDETRSPSDGSSPIRPIVRKSSLNFASLPAREPLTSNKSIGATMSRTSHLDQTRPSYYGRHTGGKSLGNSRFQVADDDHDDMDVDDNTAAQKRPEAESKIAAHNKTYTQRLQDQINLLGKSQSNGPRLSKSIPNLATSQPVTSAQLSQSSQPSQAMTDARSGLSPKKVQPVAAPGAFPDDDDDWIVPPAASEKARAFASPRPGLPKSYSTDVMEGVHGKNTVGGAEFVLPKSRPTSPGKFVAVPDRTTSRPAHVASASVPSLPTIGTSDSQEPRSPVKGVSVSNPTLSTVPEDDGAATPSKASSRSFRESPLKQVKNKLSSILKSSKGLLASSAAISAEGKSSLLSSSTTRLGIHAASSTDSIAQVSARAADVLYPDLSQHAAASSQDLSRPESPARSNSRRTRASVEREKREAKEKEKEMKEARRLAEQMEKLERLREKEREKARVFSKEQEKIAEMERKIAAQKDQERAAQIAHAAQVATPLPQKETPQATRTSPRRAKAQAEVQHMTHDAPFEIEAVDRDVEMIDAASAMPPPSVPRSTAGATSRGQPLKRPVKVTKETASKAKQAPTVIRVNTTSSQHSQFHPSNSVLAATLHDTLGGQPNHSASQHQLNSKASKASLQTKPSLQSLKSSMSSTGRPKALDLAAKRKEQEEREAQRKREAKLELERKRVAAQEEERRQEQQRRQEAETQREKEREQVAIAAEAKKNAQRQAAIEKAKQTRAPPPPVRSQPNGPPEHNITQDNAPARPPSRLNSSVQRPQEEVNRPVNAVLSNAAKAPYKRPLQQEGSDDSSRPPLNRNGQSYQSKDGKRMRMSEEPDEDVNMESQPPNNIKGPPVRPSGGFKKDLPTKSLFLNGYSNAPPSATRDLFKATVTAQHNNQAKAAHPLDMAQVSKAAIPFAPNPNPAGQQQATHKTPARPAGGVQAAKSAAKSATRSSPRFANGDAIELPEIQTDEEDDDDDAHIGVAPWADSPDLRRALMRQETVDPLAVFGPPAPLNMEEVFSKNKDRWHKFRARTSSANWSGGDRLTEEEVRRDLIARDRMRREGGWTYELSRDMA